MSRSKFRRRLDKCLVVINAAALIAAVLFVSYKATKVNIETKQILTSSDISKTCNRYANYMLDVTKIRKDLTLIEVEAVVYGVENTYIKSRNNLWYKRDHVILTSMINYTYNMSDHEMKKAVYGDFYNDCEHRYNFWISNNPI